jgi:hypothetical protein
MKKAEIVIKANKINKISIRVYFFYFKKDTKTIFAECPSLSISTYGSNLERAKFMFNDALNLWIDTVNKDRNAAAVLKELGWSISKTSVSAPIEDVFNFSAPVHLISSMQVAV